MHTHTAIVLCLTEQYTTVYLVYIVRMITEGQGGDILYVRSESGVLHQVRWKQGKNRVRQSMEER